MGNIKANILEDMFKRQKNLLKHYIEIEGLPQYPVDISSKDGQKLIKGFIHRITEELAESFQYILDVNMFANTNQVKQASLMLSEYNIEMADVWHFLLETLLYMGYEDKLEALVVDSNPHKEYSNLHSEDRPFKTFLNIAGAINYKERRGRYGDTFGNFKVVSDEQALSDPRYMGARMISDSLIADHAKLLWSITYHWQILANQFKHRDWTTGEKNLNIIKVNEALFNALLSFAIYLEFAGFTEISIATCYNYKNDINLARIKSGY